MQTNDSLKRISEQLSNFNEVELIYYVLSENTDNKKMFLTYNVICDLKSAISNEKLLRTFVATKEIIRTLYSKSNINLVFNIITVEEFESSEEYIEHNMTDENILYVKSEDLIPLAKGKRK